jgi:hypothetical protein
MCEREGANQEWYNDFAERAQTQYDLLGHIVDLIRTLTKSIENYYVVFEKEDPWMAADKREKSKRIPPTNLRPNGEEMPTSAMKWFGPGW